MSHPIEAYWVAIPGYPGYRADRYGTIYSKKTGKPMKPRVDRHGYVAINLHRADGRRVHTRVHKLVLLAYVGPRPDGLEGRHRDGDKNNNSIANLVYGTHAENMQDRVAHGTHPFAQLTPEQVRELRAAAERGEGNYSQLGERFGGLGPRTVGRIVRRQSYKAVA